MDRIHRVTWVYASICAFGVLFSVQLTGCSVIGFTTGSVIDATKPDRRLVPTGEIVRYQPGDRLVLQMRDGSELSGHYVRADRLTADAYSQAYEAARSRQGSNAGLPPLGQTVRLRRGHLFSKGANGVLSAFTHEGVEIADTQGNTRVVPYINVERFDYEGGSISRDELAEMLARGDLPLATSLVMYAASGFEVVPLDRVRLAEGPNIKSAARTGLIIGLVADAVIVVAALVVASSLDDGLLGSGGGGCGSGYSGPAFGLLQEREQMLAQAEQDHRREIADCALAASQVR